MLQPLYPIDISLNLAIQQAAAKGGDGRAFTRKSPLSREDILRLFLGAEGGSLDNGNLLKFAQYFQDDSVLLADTPDTALIQVLRQLSPVVVVDESHNAGSDLSVERGDFDKENHNDTCCTKRYVH